MSFIKIGFFLITVCVIVSSCINEETKTTEEKKLSVIPIDTAKIKKKINADYKAQRIEEIINQKVKGGFNGNVLVAQKDVIIFEGSYGYAHDTIKLNRNTKFQLASLSKTFTAVAVMKLVEDGLLGLDNTIKDYYPTFPYEGVSIRSLLSHRSGLPYYQYEFDKKVRQEKIYPTNQQIMEWFSSANPTPRVLNMPDHYFGYNNTNFAILAAIVEKVSNKTFEEYLREKILKPANMNNTYTSNSILPELNINKTKGYQYNRLLEKDHYDDIQGDKGIYSTTHDLFNWYKILKSETVLNKESLREMYTPRSFEHPGLRNYGYGFRLWVNEKQQTDYIYHTGWWKGYNTIMFFDLREDFVIILLSNKYNRSVYNIKDIVDVLNGGNKNNTIEENILDQ